MRRTVLFERWMSRIPLPLTAADRAAGYWWELSMRQVEVSRTLVFGAPRHARAFFEALVADNLDLGRPEHAELLFRRSPRGRKPKDPADGAFKTAMDRSNQGVTINAFWRHSRVKQYLKDGRALRIETVVNSPDDLGCARRLHHLPELQARARAINTRLLDTEKAGQGCVFDSPAFARISQPTLTEDGRRAPGLRFGDPRVMALAGALANTLCAVTGITNKSLRALMTGLLGTAYTTNQASYELARLARNGLITRIPHRNLYTLTCDGVRFAIFYTKVHDRVLRPLMAGDQPQAPPPLRAALRTIDHEVARRLAAARLPAAAWPASTRPQTPKASPKTQDHRPSPRNQARLGEPSQVRAVIQRAHHGGTIRVPVDFAQGRHIQMHPEQRRRRGKQGVPDQRLDRCDMTDHQQCLLRVFRKHSVQRGAYPPVDVGEAFPTRRRHLRIG